MTESNRVRVLREALPAQAIDALRMVVEGHHVRSDQILGTSHFPRIAQARAAWWQVLRELGYSTGEIGRLVDRDASTVCACTNRRARKAKGAPPCPPSERELVSCVGEAVAP